MDVKKTRHAVWQICYHFVWCPKYRRPVITPSVAKRLDDLIRNKVKEMGGEVAEIAISADHVHLIASFPPHWAPIQIMHRVKGHASRILRQEFPALRTRLPCLWTRSYYVGTAGNVSAQTIQRYIEAQKGR